MKNLILKISMAILLISCGNPQNKDTGSVEVKKSALIASTLKTWNNNQTLLITFLDGTPEQKAEVESVSKEWLKYANLNFVFYASPRDLPWRKSADIVITFKAQGNNSLVGKDSLTKSTAYSMSLSNPTNIPFTQRYFILHEFGHAIGLEHEHQHINRNFDLDEVETMRFCKMTLKLSEESCRLHMISQVSSENRYFSKYDPKSVMHYSFHSALFKTNKVEIPSSQTLSLLDKLEISKVYPGRTTKEKIIAEHNESINKNASIHIYKNCKIVESSVQQMRLNTEGMPELQNISKYSYDSLRVGDFIYEFQAEDKAAILMAMEASDYCNYDENALTAYRENISGKRMQENVYGNCQIPLDESGNAIRSVCTDQFPFEIKMKNKDELAVALCFPKFETAVLNMKSAKYCNLPVSELEELERKKSEELEVSLKYGKCAVKNNLQITNPKEKSRCRESTPWFVSDTKTFESVTFCYSHYQSAIQDMKKSKQCQP
jgi:hypothetical protein